MTIGKIESTVYPTPPQREKLYYVWTGKECAGPFLNADVPGTLETPPMRLDCSKCLGTEKEAAVGDIFCEDHKPQENPNFKGAPIPFKTKLHESGTHSVVKLPQEESTVDETGNTRVISELKAMVKPQEESKWREKNGQYGFQDMEAMCQCGHTVGDHAAPNDTSKRPCFKNGCDCPHIKKVKSKPPEESWKVTPEFKLALRFADELLDEPYADPDDHARTVARQFIRMIDRYDTLSKSIQS